MTTHHPLRWFRFTLRELLLLFLAVGLGLGWYRERQVSVPIRQAATLFVGRSPGALAKSSFGVYGDVRIMVTAMEPESWEFAQTHCRPQ